mgnify:CR=1 FL=1
MNLLILQHARVEHPGIFRNFFQEDGFRTHTVELDGDTRVHTFELRASRRVVPEPGLAPREQFVHAHRVDALLL